MPYVIKKNKTDSGTEYCVHKEGADGKPMGKSHGCHPTHDKALTQMRVLYAAEGKSFEMFGFELTENTESNDDEIDSVWMKDLQDLCNQKL